MSRCLITIMVVSFSPKTWPKASYLWAALTKGRHHLFLAFSSKDKGKAAQCVDDGLLFTQDTLESRRPSCTRKFRGRSIVVHEHDLDHGKSSESTTANIPWAFFCFCFHTFMEYWYSILPKPLWSLCIERSICQMCLFVDFTSKAFLLFLMLSIFKWKEYEVFSLGTHHAKLCHEYIFPCSAAKPRTNVLCSHT